MAKERRDVIQEILDNPMIAKKREVGIGISNVIARMRMHYGEEMKVEFWTEEGKGDGERKKGCHSRNPG